MTVGDLEVDQIWFDVTTDFRKRGFWKVTAIHHQRGYVILVGLGSNRGVQRRVGFGTLLADWEYQKEGR